MANLIERKSLKLLAQAGAEPDGQRRPMRLAAEGAHADDAGAAARDAG